MILFGAGLVLAISHGDALGSARPAVVGIACILAAGQATSIAIASRDRLIMLRIIQAATEDVAGRVDDSTEAFARIGRAASDQLAAQRRKHG